MTSNPKTNSSLTKRTQRFTVTVAIFGAAAVLGGLIKIPSPVGSIALDSLPGFFCAGFYGPLVGAVVGAIGHIGSAATAGFPLGGWIHANVAVHMFLWCGIFGVLVRSISHRLSIVVASVVAIGLNGLLSPYLLYLVGLPRETALGVVVFLVVAAAINVILAALAVNFMARTDAKHV